MKFPTAQSVAISALRQVHRFGRVLLGVSVLAFLAAFLISIHSHPASATAPASSVIVANTPLPVTGNVNATVSGPVAISGTPSVNAAQSGSWTVGISGTPTVNLGNTGPLPVTATGDPALSTFMPVSLSGSAEAPNPGNSCVINLQNPASSGQVLVVENVSFWVALSTGQKIKLMSIQASPGLPGSSLILAPTYQADDGTNAFVADSQATKLYYPAASTVITLIATPSNTNDQPGCISAITGYLVNVH